MSRYRNPLKKKIRGWKRRIRQVERWGESIKQPYLNYFISNRDSHTYNRCYLYPFYSLDKRHPPLWFYKLILSKFIAAYFDWEKAFNKIGLPYDLQLWLYDPAYIRSEITCYRTNEEGERRRFAWESMLEKPFPYDQFASPLFDLEQFDWILADDEDVIWEDDLDINETTDTQLIGEGFIRKEASDNEVYFAKRVGDIWMGRPRGQINSSSKNVVQSYFAPPKFLNNEVVDAIMKSK
jgi:hypothetical protein